jgi:PAS domain S-box-containing protein
MGPQSSVIFLAAILISAWTGGVGPALLALLILHVAHGYWFINPPGLWEPTLAWFASTGAFYLVGIVVGILSEMRAAALQRAREQQQEALAQREQLRATLACIADGVLVTDTDGDVILMNRAAEAMTGWKLSDAKGKSWQGVLNIRREDGNADVESPVARALDERRVVHERASLVLVSRLGTTIPISYSASPVSEREDDVTGVVLIFRDESERRRTELALRNADRRKDEFLATLAHELRNPLAPIVTGLELMKLTSGDALAIEEIRATMHRQTQHMVRLIEDLMDISRITRGKFELRKSQIDLADVIRDAVEATRPQFDKANHQLSVRLPAGPVLLYADGNRIAQVLTNLLDNAAKFTPAPGRIDLVAERHGTEVIIALSDTGIGIPPDRAHDIFEMFAQVNETNGYGGSGLGIGLALAKRLVEMHGGTIEARSEGRNLGTTFELRLPALSEQQPTTNRSAPKSLQPTTTVRQRVLVVDDNVDALATLSRLLVMMGNDVRQARDGLEALEVGEEFHPDVVLMDLGMPQLNGYEAARRMRQEPWGREIKLIATSGWGQHEDVRQSAEAGFDRHLVKPVSVEVLRDVLRATGDGSPIIPVR